MIKREELNAAVHWGIVSRFVRRTELGNLRDSDAISDSRNRPEHYQYHGNGDIAIKEFAPGMIYVNDRSADSICDTALEFFVIKSEYIPSHFGGKDKTSVVRWVACLYIVVAPMEVGWY